MELVSWDALAAAAPFLFVAGVLARAAFGKRRPRMDREFDFDGRKRREHR